MNTINTYICFLVIVFQATCQTNPPPPPPPPPPNCQSYECIDSNTCITPQSYQCINNKYCASFSQSGYVGKSNDGQSIYELKSPYCLDPNSQRVIDLTKQSNYVAIDAANYNCLLLDQTSTRGISICLPGHCILNNNVCTSLQVSQPTRLTTQNCAQLNITIAEECQKDSPFTTNSICFDQQNKFCTQILDFSINAIGILPNGDCVQQNKVYDKIYLCSDQSCLIKNGSGFSCVPFDDKYIGSDKDGFCLQKDEGIAVKCKKIKFCIEQTKFTCVQLTTDPNFPGRVGREKKTTNCLFQDNENGQNIEICADGLCVQTISTSSNSDFCVFYGDTLINSQGVYGPLIGVQSVSEQCLVENQQVTTNSVACAAPYTCLLGGKCLSLTDSSNTNTVYVGRDGNSQNCIEIKTYYSLFCKVGFCLLDDQCFPLDSQNVGREYKTSNCLSEKQQTNQIIQQCFDGYCISQPSYQKYSCIQLDYDINKNALGIDANNMCLPANTPVAVKCFDGVSCLQGNVCQYADPNTYNKCTLNGQCSSNLNNCTQCNYSYCLRSTTCEPIQDNCQDSLGNCANKNSGICSVCPQQHCLDKGKGICIPFQDFKLNQNECIQQIRPDMPCQVIDINNFSNESNQYCVNTQNICANQQQANLNFQCVRCANNFFNIGDNRCLSIQQRDTSKVQSTSTIFSLNLIYVAEDECQGSLCKQISQSKCPTGNNKDIQTKVCQQVVQTNYMVTLLGCVQCQEGCSSCYEMGYDNQYQKYNITADIMYGSTVYDIQTRLNYVSIFGVKKYCSSCYDDYYLDPVLNICIKYPCGQLCNQCVFQINKFYCLDCNQTAILQAIQSIQLFIGNFFFGKNSISQQMQISTFTADQCETCDQSNNQFQNTYSIYQTKCYSCKTIEQLQATSFTAFQSYFQGYQVRFDKERFQCTLCKNGDQSCYFKKVTQIYVTCLNVDSIGEGTRNSPLNLNMISEITNFDNIILGEQNPELAFVALNEISLKQLDLQLIFSQNLDQCKLTKALILKSNLQQKIKSLEVFHLNITYEQLNDKQFRFLQVSPSVIQGFTNVTISNMNIDSYSVEFDQFKIGFQISSSILKQVYFSNIKFIRKYLEPQNILVILLINLQNNLILQNVSFSNLTYNNSQVVQLQYTQNLINPSVQIKLDSVQISQVIFNASSFLQISQNNTQVLVRNNQIYSCLFDNQSIFFNYQIFNQQFINQFSAYGIILRNNQIKNFSKILTFNQFAIVSLSNIQINNNILLQETQTINQNPSLFELNCLEAKSFIVFNNTIKYYMFINVLRSKNNYPNQFHLQDIQYIQNIINSNQFIFLADINQYIDQFAISSINIKNNQIITDPSNTLQASNFISLSNVDNLVVINTELNNYGQIQLLKVLQVNNLKIKGLKCSQSTKDINNYQIVQINSLFEQLLIKNVQFQNIAFQKSLITITIKQKLHDKNINKSFQIQDVQVINCIANITQQQFSTAPIQINSQIQETITISNLLVQDSSLLYQIKANEVSTKIATCAYLEALIGKIEIINSNFLGVYSVQKNNCLVLNTKTFAINNSQFKNQYYQVDSSNTTVIGGFIKSYTQNAYITNSHFYGGRAKQGGAIYIKFDVAGYLNIQNTDFISNLSFNSFDNQNNGGALYIDSELCSFQGEIQQSTFIQNVALYQGGAIYIQNSIFKKLINIDNSQFIDCFSQNGSVFYFNFQQKQNNIFQLTNSQFNYNPITVSQNPLVIQIKNYVLSNNVNIQLLQLVGFFEIFLYNNQFMMEKQFYSSLLQANFGMKTLIQAQDVQHFIDQQSQYLNIKYLISLITFLNVEQLKIDNGLFSNSYSQLAHNFLNINSNYIQISNTQFNNNECMVCNKGLVQLNSYYLNVQNNIFKENKVQDKGILYISQVNKFNFRLLYGIYDINYPQQISDNRFENNFSQKSAGAVYIDNTSIYFVNCWFIYNKANQGNGGAIYYKGIDQKTSIKITNSNFFFNFALIGGAIYSESGQAVQNLNTKNNFVHNIAQSFSKNTFQYPHHMVALYNENQLKNNTFIHYSGKFENKLSIQFMTKENEYFEEFPVSMSLKIILNDTQNAYLSSSQITQKSGNFQLNQLALNGIFGLTVQLTFISEVIKSPIYDQDTDEIISYNTNQNKFDLIVQFAQSCELGYQHVQNQKFDFCQRCDNPFFNYAPGSKCMKCPTYGVCDGGMIFLQKGYWRLNLTSSDIYECNNQVNSCNGDVDIFQSEGKITRDQDIRYCYQGFLGPLCSDCDVYGKFWNNSYVQDGGLSCINCSKTHSSLWLFVLTVVFNSILTVYMVNSYLKQVILALQFKILYQMKIYTPRNAQQTSFYIKLIISYLQIFMIVCDIIKNQLQKYQSFLSPVSDPNKQALFSLDCSFIDFYKLIDLNYVFVKVLLGQATIISYIFLFMILYIAYKAILKQKIILIDIFSGINFIYMTNQPSVVQQIMGSASCIDLYGMNFVKSFSSVNCDDQYNLNRIKILYPLLALWTILIPLFLLFKLRKIKNNLKRLNNLKIFGIFYFEYKEQFYFWEIVKIFLKSSIVVVNNQFLDEENSLKSSILCILLLIYSISIGQFQPNSNLTLNHMEQLVYTLCSISIGLCSYLSEAKILLFIVQLFISFTIKIALSFIKVGYCQDLRGTIKQGKAQANSSNYYLCQEEIQLFGVGLCDSSCGVWFGCYDQNQGQCIYIFNSDDHQDICFLNQYCQQISSSLYIGRDNRYICLQNMQSSSNGVNFCFNSPNEICLKADSSQCIQYSSSSIYIGYIVGNGVCAQQDQRTSSNYTPQSLINLNPNYCQDSSSVIRRINFPIIGRDGSPQLNCVIFTCGPGYCIYQQTCQPLGFDGISFAKLSNGYCGQAYQSGAVQCAYPSYQICLSGNVCLWLNINNYQASGIDSQGNCLSRYQFTSSIGVCEQHHCIKSSSDNTQYACYLLDGSQGLVGISSSGACLDLNQSPAISCVQNNNSFCYDSATQQCWLTVNFQQANNGCTLNKSCFQLSNSQYVGRDKNLYCLTDTQQSSFGVDICFNDPYNVCLVSQSNSFCAIYPQSTQYLGYILETKQCAQLNQRTLSGSPANLVNLRIGYCQDQNGYIRQLNSKLYVGVDSFKYMCLQQNQTTSTQIIQCYSGFCINTNKCQVYDQTNIGRDSNYYCLTEGTAVSTECSFDIQVCFDPTLQACFYINDINPNQSGRAQNGQCAVRSQYYPRIYQFKYPNYNINVIFLKEIQSCAFNHCKIKIDPTNPNSLEGCFPFDSSLQRVGIDANGYCVFQDKPNAVRCMKGQFCLDNQNGYCCRSLVFSKDLQRYARQKDTQFCLPYLDINGKGDLVETCVLGTCIYTYFKTMKNYCLIEGNLAKGDYIVGTDILGYCVLQDQLTTIQISTCLGITYCILNVDNGQQKCQYLQDFDPDYPNLTYKAKNVNQYCQDLNTGNSIGCMDGLYCINTLDNSQCEAMISPTDINKIGRDEKTHICLPQGIQQPSKCQKEYCISQGVCIPLQNKYPGKESKTHLCLAENQTGIQGASNCYQNGCIIIDTSKGMCVDPDGYCATNGSCTSCKFNQCLSTSINNTCQDLVQPNVTYCTNNLGFCSSISSNNCVVCPNNYCMINNNGSCLTSVDLLKLLVGNSCFIQNQSNSSCLMKNIDTPDSNGNMYCTNNESFCQIISQNNSNCLLCPKYYTNPGNDICYSLTQKSGLSPNPQLLFFDMQLTYVKQDCYDQQYCLLDPTKKCSPGSQYVANPYKTCINYLVHYDNSTQIVGSTLQSNNFLALLDVFHASKAHLTLHLVFNAKLVLCADKYSIPTINGCIKCPLGCSKCYEGTRTYNFTSYLIYQRQKYDVQQRLNYNNTSSNYNLYCTECQDGYYFDQQQKLCLQIQCGQNCLLCALINNKPQCIQCDYDKLESLVNQFSYFIGILYFKQSKIPNIQDMVTLTQSGNDCQLCPIMCETCINNQDISQNPLYLYDAQCLTCKKNYLQGQQHLKNYQIVNDKSRRKCYLCQNSEQGCFYKKQKTIYTQCLDLNNKLGDGSLQNPVNYNRLNEVNIDQLILSEIEYNQAIVYYNELQVKQLEVKLVFLGDQCVEAKPQTFITTLKKQIRSLQLISINITSITNQPSSPIQFRQLSAFNISGFDQVYIQYINFQQQLNNSNFGLIIDNYLLQTFQIFNCQFLQFEQTYSSIQYFNLQLSTLQQTNITFQSVQFYNVNILKANQLVKIQNNIQDSQINFIMDSILFQNVLFDGSKIFTLNTQNITILLTNIQFNSGKLDHNSLLLNLEPNNLSKQKIDIQLQDIRFSQMQILEGSQVLNNNYLNTLKISNFTIFQSNISQTSNQMKPLFTSNTFVVDIFQISKSIVQNYYFIEQQDSKLTSKDFVQNSQFQNINIQDNQIIANSYCFLGFSTNKNSNSYIKGFMLARNNLVSQNTQAFVFYSNLNTIKIQNVTMIDNNSFIFLDSEKIINIFISQVNVTQTQVQYLAPQICQLNQILNYISISDINLQDIIINTNIISIVSSEISLNNINPFDNQSIQSGISISKISSTQLSLLVESTIQNSAPIFINSKQDTTISIDDINFLQTQTIMKTSKTTFGYISLGFYFKAPTVQITFTKANFKDQDVKSLFSWIQGVAKSISFQQCNFTNTFQVDQSSYFKNKQLKKGGHIYIQAETFTVQYSRFINGFALYGGSTYWIAKNFGKMYVFNCTFDSNTAFSYDDHESEGGALFIDNQISASLEIIIEQSFFFSNFAQWKGGAIQFVQTSLPRTAVFFLNTQFINNLSSQGSNFNIENQKTSKTIVVMKNIDSINQIDFMLKKIQLIIPLINSVSWQESQYQQSSIFYLNNPYDVQIFNSKFQIYSDNIQSIQPQFINILLFQRLFIINNANKIIDSSNNYQYSHYLDNLVTITQASELYIYNSTLLNNKNIFDLLDTPSQKMIINTVQYDSIKCYIYQFKSFNNECKYCNQGTIYVLSNSLLVLQSIFQKNVAQYGSALYIQNNLQNNNSILDSKQFNFQITESQFLSNHANMKGGAIFIKQTPLIITSSNFIENLATNQGGAIYLENSQQDILQNALSFKTSNFVNNQAQLGGAIASNIGQSINYYQNNTFSQNKASIYGQNIQVSPNQLNVYIDGILQNFTQTQTQQIIVSNHQGGQIKQNIVFKFSTEQNEEIVNLSSNIILNLQLQNGQGYINKNTLQQQSGVFNLTKQIQVYGNMGQQITLSITSDLIQRPQYNSSNYIVGYDKNYQLILIIQFAKICPIGLVKKNIYGQFNYCFPCQDSYSFTNSETCFKCPNTDVKCFGNQILLTSNYWRVNQQSAQLFNCKNCLGEYPVNTNQIQVVKYRKILSDQNYYCQIGYIGALCEDCDFSGEYWGQKYFLNLNQKCQKCSDINPSQILYPLCLSIVILFIITKMTQSYQLQVRNNMLYVSCQTLFKKQILYFQENSVNIMKLFLFQLFVIGTVFYYDQKSPNIVSLILIDVGNLFISQVRIADCFLGQQTQINFLIKNIIFYLSTWILILICIIFYSLIKKISFKFRFMAQEITLSLWIFIYHSQNALLSKLFKLIKCQYFDTQSFVTDYLSQYCDATQLKLSYYVFAPLYILTLLTPQAVFLYKLHKMRYFLNSYKNKVIYGYFTQEYKQKFFFWDQVKLTYKTILGIIAMFSYQFDQLQPILSIIVSLTYSLILLICQPYKKNQLNQIDFKIQYLTSILFCFNNLQFQIDDSISKLVFTGINSIIILNILYKILIESNFGLKYQYIFFIRSLQQKSKICKFVIDKLKLNSQLLKFQKCQKNWQRIKELILCQKQKSIYELFKLQKCDCFRVINYYYFHQKILDSKQSNSEITHKTQFRTQKKSVI
ncbi:hypothetical protein ABPG73_004485 [Tetrahymena malaccensis]